MISEFLPIVRRFECKPIRIPGRFSTQKTAESMKQRGQVVGDYILGRTLGTGATGKVKLASHKESGETFAVKIIEKSKFKSNPEVENKLKREIALMRLLDHPHLLKLFEVFEAPHHLYLVLEYASHGELFDFLVTRHVLEPREALLLFREIVYGLDYMHSIGICHRDLKVENLLLDEFDHVKIGDFGFARWMPSNLADTACGSPHYTAPEVIAGLQYDGRGADVWSAGVILFALVSGHLPFEDASVRGLVAKVKAGDYTIPQYVAPVLQDLIRQILSVDVTKRITISQIKAHPAFKMFLPAKYIVPAPLPTPTLLDPIDFDGVDDYILAILRSIGYADDAEIRRELESRDTSMAKVFFSMCMRNRSVENLPWPSGEDAGGGAELDSAFLMPPQTIATEGIASNPLVRERSLGISSLGSRENSLAAHADWGDSPAPAIEAEEEQAFTDIPMGLPEMMTELQVFLREMAIDWFHPNDQELIGRTADRATYVGLDVTISGTGQVDLSVRMLHGDAQRFGQFVEAVTRLVERVVT